MGSVPFWAFRNETVAFRNCVLYLRRMNRNETVSFSPDPRRWWVLVVLSASLLVIGLDNTILNVALPTLQSDLGSTSSQLQWIVDSYMLVFAGLLLTAGALGDRFGRKRALAFGLTVFGLGSGLSALATSPDMLIATRALMGIGGAFIMPSTLSIITAVFPPDERPKAIGAWAAVSGLGIAIGPVAGGYLIEHSSWHAIFLVNLPFVAAALIAGRFLIPESKDPSAPRLDVPGFALSIAGLTTLVWAIIEAPSRGWTDGTILAAFGVAAVVLGAFLAWELRAREPMLDVRLFRNPRFSGASGAITFVFFALMGSMFFLTQYLQDVLGYSALGAGLRVSPVALGLVIGGPLSAKLAARFGTRVVVAAGLVLVAAGLSIATQFEAGTGYGLVLMHLLVMGFGMGMAMAPATDSVMGSVPVDKASVGSAVNDTTRTTGGALGVAILGSLLASRYRGDMDHAVAGLPHRAADLAGDSLGGGLAVAHKLGSPALADAAHSAFVSGMHVAAVAAAGVALLGALIAIVVIPGRERSSPRRSARAWSRSPHERDRRVAPAHAGAAPLRGVAPGDHPGDARAAARGRLRLADDGARADAGGRRARRRSTAAGPPRRSSCATRSSTCTRSSTRPDTGSLRGDYEALAEARAGTRRTARARRVHAAAARRGGQRPRAARDLLRQPRRARGAALRTCSQRAVARGEIRERRRPRAGDRPVRRPGRLPAADHAAAT